jgi:hypothetical protein
MKEIVIHNLTMEQKVILDALWTAKSNETITALMIVFGKKQVQAMQQMLLAASLDVQDIDTSEAKSILSKF